jgi:hypothetical protein
MSDKNEIERLGVNAVERAFLEMGWLFREQTISDYGIDAHAEPKANNVPTGQLIALQIKTGQSYFKKRGKNFVFHGNKRHLEYWQNHVLPVFIVMYNPENGLVLWQRVENHLITHRKNGRWSIEIPPHQVLNADADPFLRRGISSHPASVRRFRLAVDLPLIREVAKMAENDAVFLTLDEWINKSLNFRESQIRFGDPDSDPVYEFVTWLPMSDVNEVMNYYFPWLDYEYAREIENFSCEVEQHVLEVQVNELGRAFLTVEDFIDSGSDPKEVLPFYESPSDSVVHEYDFDEDEYR